MAFCWIRNDCAVGSGHRRTFDRSSRDDAHLLKFCRWQVPRDREMPSVLWSLLVPCFLDWPDHTWCLGATRSSPAPGLKKCFCCPIQEEKSNVSLLFKLEMCTGLCETKNFPSFQIFLSLWSCILMYWHEICLFQVVLKKLAHDFELEHMDKHLLHHAPRLTSSHSHPFKLVSDAVRPYTHHHLLLKQEHDLQGNGTYVVQHIRVFDLPLHANSDGSESQQVGSDLLLCPSQRKFLYIEDRFVKDSWGVNRLTSLYNLMTILLVNSEPLIFQVSRSYWLPRSILVWKVKAFADYFHVSDRLVLL